MTNADLTTRTNDFDTLGGRLSSARDARELSLGQVAKMAGVEARTLKAWESDRATPRSNRLTMLAGILGTSPTWLLFGRGSSPMQVKSRSNVESAELEIDRLKNRHRNLSAEIENVEESLQQIELELQQ